MNKQLLKDSFGWGFILWLIGYLLGIALFFVVPQSILGWIITPIGASVAIWVVTKKVESVVFPDFLIIAVVWTATAMILDYFLIVKAFNPADGYYKLDVYLYYLLTFVIPVGLGWRRSGKSR